MELSSRNRQALIHYRQCKATGRFPDDPIVARNAEIINTLTETIREAKTDRLTQTIEALTIVSGVR